MRTWMVGVICFFAGVILTPVCIWLYLESGRPPVAVADSAFPFEKQIVRIPLHHRIDAELQQAPLHPVEADFVAGANIYKANCAFCHGFPNRPAAVARNMYPSVPQLWQKHKNGVVGVSDDPPGETFWRVQNGIRLTGMPAYKNMLSETQMWQVSLLLASAAKPLPQPVQSVLDTP